MKSSKIIVFKVFRQIHKKIELGAEERIPGFFSESPPLMGCDIDWQGESIIHLKNL